MAAEKPQKPNRGQVQVIRSSLPYQVLLYLNAWYFGLFFICEILLFFYKGETLPYATGVLPAEVILIFILAGIEALRLFFARKGNLTERIVGVIVSILLSVPALLGGVFYLYWQTYVMRADVILASIQLAFIGLELIFGIVSIITFARVFGRHHTGTAGFMLGDDIGEVVALGTHFSIVFLQNLIQATPY